LKQGRSLHADKCCKEYPFSFCLSPNSSLLLFVLLQRMITSTPILPWLRGGGRQDGFNDFQKQTNKRNKQTNRK